MHAERFEYAFYSFFHKFTLGLDFPRIGVAMSLFSKQVFKKVSYFVIIVILANEIVVSKIPVLLCVMNEFAQKFLFPICIYNELFVLISDDS